ncbi:STAS domain-containing protein [Streptomyces sp. NPDC058655]|uniref:STAS domain-containing protein n=1 Tax=unclassified Streptomyces TaxID=2593676 RepID=UPI0036491AE7
MSQDLGGLVVSEIVSDSVWVRVSGDVDADTAPVLEEALSAGTTSRFAGTVVDLSETSFADSSILHVLLTQQRAHREAGRTFVLAGPFTVEVARLFEITGTLAAFTVAPDSLTALGFQR